MTFQQLNYVITIADAGSMNKASEILYVSQPSLTNAIKELERELGIALFTRSGKGVSLTADGEEFLLNARSLWTQYEMLREKYIEPETRKIKFGISTQHYSFAVKAFVELVKTFGMTHYDFAIRETRTQEVIQDVAALKSEIGILYLSDFNRVALNKLFHNHNLEFHSLCRCQAYVYLWRGHPLAHNASITFEQLAGYPCLSFEQGGNGSFYFAEEILTTKEYPCTIHTNDRATNLNLMIALNAYTLCSGVICEELNGSEYVAVPFLDDAENRNCVMEIGYIMLKNQIVSEMGSRYIMEIKKYLNAHTERTER